MAARDSLEALDHGVLRFLTAGSVDDAKRSTCRSRPTA